MGLKVIGLPFLGYELRSIIFQKNIIQIHLFSILTLLFLTLVVKLILLNRIMFFRYDATISYFVVLQMAIFYFLKEL